MKLLPGSKCVSELLSIPHLVTAKIYRLPFTGLLRCMKAPIIISMEWVVGISEVNGMALVEFVVGAGEESRRELEKRRDKRLVKIEEITGGKLRASVLIDPNDPWSLVLGRDADGKTIFLKDLNT